jgi:transposase
MSRDSPPRPPKFHSRREVAEAIGVTYETVSAWLKVGKLKGLTLRDVLEFDRERRKG